MRRMLKSKIELTWKNLGNIFSSVCRLTLKTNVFFLYLVAYRYL